ncbi:hypothetical protein [Chitinilyticum aquatile]|uniref:hypothetical protein n=1 Tax=Chitinilyticum aquatile TaxID=362520 RepID=UPI0003F7951E|nr:hypothetical protein [Chitinilyticum aquatile]
MNTFAMWLGYAVMACAGVVATIWLFFWCLDFAFKRLKLMPALLEFVEWKQEAKRDCLQAAAAPQPKENGQC